MPSQKWEYRWVAWIRLIRDNKKNEGWKSWASSKNLDILRDRLRVYCGRFAYPAKSVGADGKETGENEPPLPDIMSGVILHDGEKPSENSVIQAGEMPDGEWWDW